MSDYLNGHNNKASPENNIVAMPTAAERDQMRREKEKQEHRKKMRVAEPMINMPPVTKYLIGLILGIHIVLSEILSPETRDVIVSTLGFTPEKFHNGFPALYTLLSPLTHMLLHGSWMHVTMNLFMLAAFGSGLERWIGSRRMLALFILSGLFGVATHFVLNTTSSFPMIGASGGLSGLFAGALIMLSRGQREMGGRFGILPFALLWIGLSIGFGMLGGPDGSMIAWAAHVGGFLGGFIVLKAMRV